MLIVGLVIFAMVSPVGIAVGLGVLALVGIGCLLVGAVGMLVVPFQESVVCGLCSIFVPFYSLYYVITRWDEMRRWVGIYLLGVMMFVGMGVLLPAIGAARQAARRAQAQANGVADEEGGPPPFGTAPAPMQPPGVPPGFMPPPGVPAPPRFMPPGGFPQHATGPSITIVVTGIPEGDDHREERDAIGREINAIHAELNPAGPRTSSMQGNRNRHVYTVTPVNDPRAFADKITFGRVRRVVGQRIDVVYGPTR